MSRQTEGIKLRRRHGRDVWYARATLPGGERWEASTGVALTGDRGEASRKAAALYLAAITEFAGRRAAIPSSIAKDLELTDLAADYLADERATYKGHDGRHHGRLETDIDRYILPRWTHVEQITSAAWLDARAALHKGNGGDLGWRSIGHLANTLRHFLRWARAKGAIATVPEIESPKSKDQRAEQAPRKAMNAKQRDRFLQALRGMKEFRAERIYRGLFFSLLRKGELAALTLRWVNFGTRIVTVPADHSKSGETEEIHLHPDLARAIRGEMKARGKLTFDEPVFGKFDFHQANTPELLGGIFGRACLRAKLVKLVPVKPHGAVPELVIDFDGLTAHHVTRHSSATIAAGKRGTTLEELMALGRWKDAQIPSRYLHPTVAAGRRASRRL